MKGKTEHKRVLLISNSFTAAGISIMQKMKSVASWQM